MRAMLASAMLATVLAHAQNVETISVAGLRAPAEILVDRWGVPHIYAHSEDDAFFVQGFNAARDRLFQIDLWRRRGLGQLAEVMGAEYAEQDRAARLFLYRGAMEKEWAAYSPGAQRAAERFSAGINAFIDHLASHPEALPIEFRLLGYGPAKWDAADVVRIRSHGLTRNANSEVARAKTVCAAGVERGPSLDQARLALQPAWETKVPEGLDPCLPADVLGVFTLATKTVAFSRAAPGEASDEGSNNWAIAPAKSATGRAILAGDPHRAYATPSLRYIVHLNAPGLDVIGAGEPALPGVSMGHNGAIAFGLTIFNIDQEDLYVYEINPANPLEYRYRGGWEKMRVERETLLVKGGAPRTVELAFTRHGPVIYRDTARHRAYALRTCWLEPGMSPYFGSIGYMRARTFAEFREARFRGGAPTVNQVYADVKGNIGWSPGGMAPRRPNWDGLMPVPGDGRYEWNGFLRGDEFPSSYNPASGYVTTSNELNLPAGYPYAERKLGFEWTNNSRHTRIDEVLRGLKKVSIEDSMKLQCDTTSIVARRMVALIAKLKPANAAAAKAVEFLRGWDAAEGPESGPAALFEVWWSKHLGTAFLRAALPGDIARVVAVPDTALLLDTLEGRSQRFRIDDATREKLLTESLAAAWTEMLKLGGADPRQWQWGKLHQSWPPHPLRNFVDAATKARLMPGPFPAPGGPYSPSQSAYVRGSFAHTAGASFRMVLDVGNWDGSKAVNYPGQSGNPNDAHYRDLADAWRKGEYFPLLYSREVVEKATERRIALQPAARTQ